MDRFAWFNYDGTIGSYIRFRVITHSSNLLNPLFKKKKNEKNFKNFLIWISYWNQINI